MRHAVRGRRIHRWVLAGAALAVLWVAYFIGVAMLVPDELRRAADRAGLRLEVGSVRSLYPGELRIRDVELEIRSIGAFVSARQITVDPNWRSLFSSASAIEEARASQLALRWARGSFGPIEARMRGPAKPSGDSDYRMLEMDGTGARWRSATQAATLTLRGRVELRYDESEPGRIRRVVLGEGVIDLSEVVLVDARRATAVVEADAPLGISALLRIESALFDAKRGFEAAGRLYVKGPDASIGLDLARARESVRWMLSELEGQAFELESILRACGTGLALDGVHLASGLTLASGALRFVAGAWTGALQVRRGSFSLGVSVVPRGIQTRLSPQPFWLDAELARLRNVCAVGGF